MLLLNAFSLNMISDFPANVRIEEISVGMARSLLQTSGLESAVGHADTAALFSNLLMLKVPANRATIGFSSGTKAIVGQYVGPRLPEGSTNLPEGSTVKWLFVSVQ